MIDTKQALERFEKLIEMQRARVAAMQAQGDFVDYAALDKIIIGVCGGDGIGPVITHEAERVLRFLLADEVKAGKVEFREIDGLTIENRGEIPPEAASSLGDSIYGCDRCQQACPWMRFARPTDEVRLHPRDGLLAMRRADWRRLDVETYRRLFKGSAVKRAKFEGLTRNIRATDNAPMDEMDH